MKNRTKAKGGGKRKPAQRANERKKAREKQKRLPKKPFGAHTVRPDKPTN